MRKLKLTSLPRPKWPILVQVPLDDGNLPDEIKKLVSEGNVESIVYYGSGYGMQAKYKVIYKKTTKTLDILLMNSFGLKERLTKKQFKLKNCVLIHFCK